MQRRKVDLPDPDGPMMHTTSPAGTVREMPLSASWLPNDLQTSAARTIGSAEVAAVTGTPRPRPWFGSVPAV